MMDASRKHRLPIHIVQNCAWVVDNKQLEGPRCTVDTSAYYNVAIKIHICTKDRNTYNMLLMCDETEVLSNRVVTYNSNQMHYIGFFTDGQTLELRTDQMPTYGVTVHFDNITSIFCSDPSRHLVSLRSSLVDKAELSHLTMEQFNTDEVKVVPYIPPITDDPLDEQASILYNHIATLSAKVEETKVLEEKDQLLYELENARVSWEKLNRKRIQIQDDAKYAMLMQMELNKQAQVQPENRAEPDNSAEVKVAEMTSDLHPNTPVQWSPEVALILAQLQDDPKNAKFSIGTAVVVLVQSILKLWQRDYMKYARRLWQENEKGRVTRNTQLDFEICRDWYRLFLGYLMYKITKCCSTSEKRQFVHRAFGQKHRITEYCLQLIQLPSQAFELLEWILEEIIEPKAQVLPCIFIHGEIRHRLQVETKIRRILTRDETVQPELYMRLRRFEKRWLLD